MQNNKNYTLVMAARNDRSLAKYTIISEFETEEKLQTFCKKFSSEHEILDYFYGKYDFMYDLLGDNLEESMQALAFDKEGSPIKIKYYEELNYPEEAIQEKKTSKTNYTAKISSTPNVVDPEIMALINLVR